MSTDDVNKQYTAVDFVCAKLDWRIAKFDRLMKLMRMGQDLVSDKFSVPKAPDVAWELHIYPKGKREEDATNVSLFLRQVGMRTCKESLMTDFRIYCICTGPGQQYSICRDNKDFVHQQGRGKFKIPHERMSQALLGDGTLHIVCEIEYVPPGDAWKTTDTTVLPGQLAHTSVDLRPLLVNGMLSDCVIKVGDTQLKCHRCILALHSDVFRSMFEHSTTTEARNGLIDLTDTTTVNAARSMLEFMYTGTVKDSSDHSEDLLLLADKYGVINLKELCENALTSAIAVSNACQILIFADTYHATRLRDAVIEFVSQNHGDVLESREWKELKKTNPALSSDVLEVVLGGRGTKRSLSTASLTYTPSDATPATSSESASDVAPIEKPSLTCRKRTRRSK